MTSLIKAKIEELKKRKEEAKLAELERLILEEETKNKVRTEAFMKEKGLNSVEELIEKFPYDAFIFKLTDQIPTITVDNNVEIINDTLEKESECKKNNEEIEDCFKEIIEIQTSEIEIQNKKIEELVYRLKEREEDIARFKTLLEGNYEET